MKPHRCSHYEVCSKADICDHAKAHLPWVGKNTDCRTDECINIKEARCLEYEGAIKTPLYSPREGALQKPLDEEEIS